MSVVRRKQVWPDGGYVEVTYNPNWKTSDGLRGWVDVRCFKRDPRKLQYHKPKFRCCGSTHGPAWLQWTDKSNYACWSKYYAVAVEIFKELRLTSSNGRALTS